MDAREDRGCLLGAVHIEDSGFRRRGWLVKGEDMGISGGGDGSNAISKYDATVITILLFGSHGLNIS